MALFSSCVSSGSCSYSASTQTRVFCHKRRPAMCLSNLVLAYAEYVRTPRAVSVGVCHAPRAVSRICLACGKRVIASRVAIVSQQHPLMSVTTRRTSHAPRSLRRTQQNSKAPEFNMGCGESLKWKQHQKKRASDRTRGQKRVFSKHQVSFN